LLKNLGRVDEFAKQVMAIKGKKSSDPSEIVLWALEIIFRNPIHDKNRNAIAAWIPSYSRLSGHDQLEIYRCLKMNIDLEKWIHLDTDAKSHWFSPLVSVGMLTSVLDMGAMGADETNMMSSPTRLDQNDYIPILNAFNALGYTQDYDFALKMTPLQYAARWELDMSKPLDRVALYIGAWAGIFNDRTKQKSVKDVIRTLDHSVVESFDKELSIQGGPIHLMNVSQLVRSLVEGPKKKNNNRDSDLKNTVILLNHICQSIREQVNAGKQVYLDFSTHIDLLKNSKETLFADSGAIQKLKITLKPDNTVEIAIP
jgi:hypothetical protein